MLCHHEAGTAGRASESRLGRIINSVPFRRTNGAIPHIPLSTTTLWCPFQLSVPSAKYNLCSCFRFEGLIRITSQTRSIEENALNMLLTTQTLKKG